MGLILQTHAQQFPPMIRKHKNTMPSLRSLSAEKSLGFWRPQKKDSHRNRHNNEHPLTVPTEQLVHRENMGAAMSLIALSSFLSLYPSFYSLLIILSVLTQPRLPFRSASEKQEARQNKAHEEKKSL